MHLSRRRFLAGSLLLSTGAASVLLAGCGSGGGKSGGGGSRSTAPTATTRAHVQGLHGQVARQLTSSGAPSAALAFTRNSYAGAVSNVVPVTASGSDASGGVATSAPLPSTPVQNAVPNLGGFLKNVAAASPKTRAARLRKTRDADPSPGTIEPIVPVPDPPTDSFYYDYYLELWTQTTYTPTGVTYALYVDEAKTQPAGSIVTVQPADYNTYPQVYDSSYSFTAGYLAGSHGTSKNTTNADGSFVSDYSNVYQDGTSDSGKSNGSASGDFSWQSRSDGTNKSWTQGAGTFRSDGSGGTRFSTSDGYEADYTYNANGSGQGKISGSDPGMPVTITWDAYGNTTVRYADGSVETYNAYAYYGDGGGVTGSTNDSGTTTSPPPPSTTPGASPSPVGI